MEALYVLLKSLDVMPRSNLAVAHVTATTERTVNGQPAAQIDLRVSLRAVQGESSAAFRTRARDLALEYLAKCQCALATVQPRLVTAMIKELRRLRRANTITSREYQAVIAYIKSCPEDFCMEDVSIKQAVDLARSRL